jgi:DNA-binding PadR family transcriptional regulator
VPMSLPEWTVLVLLSQRPAHGFAVSQLTAADGDLGRIWRIPRPVIYRAIGRLLDAGLITPESVEAGLGPQRTIYTVTHRVARQPSTGWPRRWNTSGISGRTCC